MCFNFEFGWAEVITTISLLTVIIGGFFTLFQWKKKNNRQKAEYINELTEKIRTDPDIRDIVYVIDDNLPWYSKSFHGSGELERKIDKTLSYFSYICYLRKQHVITKKEFCFFQYEIDRILMNAQVMDYFYNLYHFAGKFSLPITFQYLFQYGEKNKMIDEDFYDNTSFITNNKYHKNINI